MFWIIIGQSGKRIPIYLQENPKEKSEEKNKMPSFKDLFYLFPNNNLKTL